MIENVENLILEMLKGLRNEVQTVRSEMHDEYRDVKPRLQPARCPTAHAKPEQSSWTN